jgi:lysophospholipase L1-like esterase
MKTTDFIIELNAIHIKAGNYESQGHSFSLTEDLNFTVPPAPVVWMENEALHLSKEIPQGFNIGTRLSGPNARDINALGALIPSKFILRKAPEGETLAQGRDYLLSAQHALLGIGPDSCVSPSDIVYASYAYGLLRLDSVYLDGNDHVCYTPGIPHITTPYPPHIPEDGLRLVNIFRPYKTTTLKPEHLYPVTESPELTHVATTPGRIPKTLRKLRDGERVVIVCWGDSVTAGGNASETQYRYTDVFAAGLQRMFPQAQIEVINVSVGGSSSVNWLYPTEYRFSISERQHDLDFSRVTKPKPDLVTLEFVNDAGLDEATRDKTYETIRQHLDRIGAEWILITPHFTHPSWMGMDMRGRENRPYVRFLKTFAKRYNVALADASERWAHLWKEGIPYLSLLHNSVNHPDNRGHRIFAEELWKCFAS